MYTHVPYIVYYIIIQYCDFMLHNHIIYHNMLCAKKMEALKHTSYIQEDWFYYI